MNTATKTYSTCMNEHDALITAALGRPAVVIYSAYNTGEDGLPINNLNELVITGNGLLIAETDEFWGEGKFYTSKVIEDATWLDIAVLADEMVRTVGDYHHVYLENIYYTGESFDGIPTYKFSMGS